MIYDGAVFVAVVVMCLLLHRGVLSLVGRLVRWPGWDDRETLVRWREQMDALEGER